MIALVAAMDRNGVIGQGGKMPWHLPAELKHFRRLTRGQTVVMGRKTYEAIGGALRDRTNIVLTRDPGFQAPGCELVHNLDELLNDPRPLYVIGGAEIYRQFLPYADIMHLTRIDAEFPGDTFFPAMDPAAWRLTEAQHHAGDERNPYGFSSETYHRVRT